MELLQQFALGMARVGGPWGTAFVVLFAVTRWLYADLPRSAVARDRWIVRLRIDAFSGRYRAALAAGLDWIDARLSPGFERDAAAPKTEVARAWSAKLLDLLLLLAVLYPLLSLLIDWAVTGDAGRIGPLEVLPASDDHLARAAAVGGLAGMLGVAYAARRARSTRLRLLLAVVAGGLWLAVAGADAGAGAGAFAGAFAFAGALAGAFAFAFAGTNGLRMTGRAAGRGGLFAVALGAPLAIIGLVVAAPDDAAAVIVLFAAIGASGGAVSGAIAAIGGATGRPARALGAFAALAFGAVAFSVAVSPRLNEPQSTLILFLCLLPLLNAAADFGSTGLTRWWLRQGLRGNLVGHALRDAGAAFGILAALGFALIATIRWVTPRDGTPLINLKALLDDLTDRPGDYYWLYFCFFSTLLPTVLHLSAACFGLFTLLSKRLGRPIAELLEAGASNSVKAKLGVVALSLCVSAAILAPVAALYAVFALFGETILAALLALFEWWARRIGAIPA